VLGYGQRLPVRVITGATARTTFTPDRPAVSNLQLDMGVACRCAPTGRPDRPVNGQDPYTSWVLDLPVRNDDGSLAFAPALLPRTADTAAAPLPLTPANLIRQAFKFLGERYGWGHSFDTRDCSGFVSEIYRSVGVLLPRNTSAQAVSPALQVPLPPSSDRAGRLAALKTLHVGDLVYIPGHVMMVIGHVDGLTWVIHDTSGTTYTGADGKLVRARLNGVSVTPLEPMMLRRRHPVRRPHPASSAFERLHEDHRHPPGHAARAAQDAVQDRAAHGGNRRGHRRADPHRYRPRRLRRGAADAADHRRYPRLDHRGDRALHPSAPDRPGNRQPQPHHRPGAGIDGAQHQRQGRGGNRRLRPVGAAARAPLYQMLGGGDPVITTDITISVDHIDKMVADSLSAMERGFDSLKIKVGKDIGLDIERVKAIHAAVDGRALLRLDANQGWTAKQAVYAMHTLEEAGVVLELLEQPVKASDIDGLKYVTDRVHTPVMADESVFSPARCST
jgi:cell wall-associated NlpC family hydrolase